jgi:hypothetical protein
MQITPDGKDVVLASGSPDYQEVFQVSDLSAAGTYPAHEYPNAVSIAGDGTVAAGTCCGYLADGSESNEILMFAPGSTIPENTISFGSVELADDGAALTPDGSLLFVVTLASVPMLNIIPNPKTTNPTSTVVTCSPGTVVISQDASCTATVTDTAAASATTPTGTVTFTSDTSDGSFSGISCALSPASSGQASCTVSYTPGEASYGIDTITGTYGGDSAHTASSGQDTGIVGPRDTITALNCQQVKPVLSRCTAVVSDISPGAASPPTGTVSFASSGHGVFSATQCTLSGSGTSASCTVYYATAAGVLMRGQTITANYSGDLIHQSSWSTTTLT